MDNFIGRTLGQYQLETLLGSGGMGQVYRSVHKLLNRPAAVKVMLTRFASHSQFRKRFLQEARAAAGLQHPNIIEIYEFGEQEGILFLVMELMSDGSLSGLLRRQQGNPLPLPLALNLASQVAQGLATAHVQQIIHRDIKPANLLLQRIPGGIPGREQCIVKITDFGLARLLDSSLGTVTGTPLGTLAYMSPEQLVGSKQLDGRSDLYALGVVLYEMVTGYLPFQISRIDEAIQKHIHTPPPSPREVCPDLPPMVDEIIMRCLAKDPEERFASGTALATALQHVLGNSEKSLLPTIIITEPQTLVPTVLEAPGAEVEHPPAVSTMPGYADVPRVRVLDQAGRTLQVVEVRAEGITVGRESDNDIVLRSRSISRRHLRISWDGQEVTATDLRSSNGTALDDMRLLPEVAQPWKERQMVRLGSFWLRLESASASPTQAGQDVPPEHERIPQDIQPNPAAPVTASAASLQVMPSLINARIGLSVAPKTLSITPGQPATVQVTLTNLGVLVDWFIVTVEGVPAEWVQGTGLEVQLNPGMQETVNLLIDVARQPGNKAQNHHVAIRARSREQPEEFSLTNTIWIVEPFREEAIYLEPRRVVGRGRATYSIALQNNSNVSSRYTLNGDDDEQKLAYNFKWNPIDLDAGQELRVPLMVRTRRRWLGREQRMPFQLRTGLAGKPHTQTTFGEFVNKPLLPAWVVPAVAALLVVATALAAWLGYVPLPGHAATSHALVRTTPTATPTASPIPSRPAPGSTTSSSSSPSGSPSGATPTPTPAPSPTSTPTPAPKPTPTPTQSPALFVPPHVTQVAVIPGASGLGGAFGSQYVASQDSLYFVEAGSGRLAVIRNVHSNPNYAVLGTGYTLPEDVVIASDGDTAYITELSVSGSPGANDGDLVKVSLTSGPNRTDSDAVVIAAGLHAPQQFAIDAKKNIAYVAESNGANPIGDIVTVDLGTGAVTPFIANIPHPTGVLLSANGNTLYVTEQLSDGTGQLLRYDVTHPANAGTLLASTSTIPLLFLSWANPAKTVIFVAEGDPANKVWYFDLNNPQLSLQLGSQVAFEPASVAVVSNNNTALPMLVCTFGEIDELT